MTIKVLGPGCMNCKTLKRRVEEALEELGIVAHVEKVEEYPAIASYGILSTPGLIIEDRIVSQGRVPTVEAIRELIMQVHQ